MSHIKFHEVRVRVPRVEGITQKHVRDAVARLVTPEYLIAEIGRDADAPMFFTAVSIKAKRRYAAEGEGIRVVGPYGGP